MTEEKNWGSFTLPGESGYEELTLQMAKKWGADVIRDSDGTVLSDSITNSGYGIYSTLCIIRDHNAWANDNLDTLQQSFLMTTPLVAKDTVLTISLMKDFFAEQFKVNSTPESIKYWQVFDRTTNTEIDKNNWTYDEKKEEVTVNNIIPWHKYTVNFLAYRIWEEISMYNHTTNNWDKEHLMQIDPFYPNAQEYLLNWLENWCVDHPKTTVVRFTSMFYNFVWIWGSNENNRHLFTDWASYDFTVSTYALDKFKEKYGYSMTSEDFINKGLFHVTHMPATKEKLDWMEFINDFVISFGKKLIDLVHKYGKLAYVFYDDSWVGIEPYGKRFKEFGFDGIIKCVFSGFEARLCSQVPVDTHEIRLHPYLFPVGLNGTPTFMEGGDPTTEAKRYWLSVRRALLRSPIERIGLGGYLHLVEPFPDFCDYIEEISNEFRFIKKLHGMGKPYSIKPKVGVLTTWGELRAWTLSGHFHETDKHDLIHINEALSGLPVNVSFINFEDIKNGALGDLDIIINAGTAGSAWSGGDYWRDEQIVSLLTSWVDKGGTFLGVGEPSAVDGYDTYFRMSHILGVDKDTGARASHGKWSFEINEEVKNTLIPENSFLRAKDNIYLTDGLANVLSASNNLPAMTVNSFGKGHGIYLSSFTLSTENIRLLLNILLYTQDNSVNTNYITDNLFTECAYFPDNKTLVIINNSDKKQETNIQTEYGVINTSIEAFSNTILTLS